jgi:tetratricopeptide (TPR) repeat protein
MKDTTNSIDRHISLLHKAIIIVVGLIVYINCIDGHFLWDDLGLIVNNAHISNLSNLANIFTEDVGAGVKGGMSNFYRPMQSFLYAVGYALWGLKVHGYHFISIALHILVSLAIYLFVYLLCLDRKISLITSLLFVSHPIHTEAVCYISGVADPLYFLFLLMCFVLYLTAKDTKTYILSLICFIAALFSKENALILPALIILYHACFSKRIVIGKVLPFWLIAFVYLVLRFFWIVPFRHPFVSVTGLLQRVPGFFVAISEYVRLLFLPYGLHMDYGDKLFKLSDPRAITGIVLTCSLVSLAILSKKKRPLISFAALWFFLCLFMVSNIYQINLSFMMEHWLYGASLGFFMASSYFITRIFSDNKRIFYLSVISIISIYAVLTIKQCTYWKSPISFYKRSLYYTPDSWRSYNELGLEYSGRGDAGKAIECFKNALGINPNILGVYNNLANVLISIGKKEEATLVNAKANKIRAELFRDYYEKGNRSYGLGKYKEALSFYMQALEFSPDNLDLYNRLATVFVVMGRYSNGISALEKAVEINPNIAITYNNLAVAYYYAKKYNSAVESCDKAVKLGYPVSPRLLHLLKPFRK